MAKAKDSFRTFPATMRMQDLCDEIEKEFTDLTALQVQEKAKELYDKEISQGTVNAARKRRGGATSKPARSKTTPANLPGTLELVLMLKDDGGSAVVLQALTLAERYAKAF